MFKMRKSKLDSLYPDLPLFPYGSKDNFSIPNILIVDDNTFNVYSLQLLIEETFHLPCDIAYSAKEALIIIKDRLA
jgi:hypothetical protein